MGYEGQYQWYPSTYPVGFSPKTRGHLYTRKSKINIRWHWREGSYEMTSPRGFSSSALPEKICLFSLPQIMFNHITCTLDSDTDASKFNQCPKPYFRVMPLIQNLDSAFNILSPLPDNSKVTPPSR